MLTRLLALSRYFTIVAVFGILLASVALLAYEGLVVMTALIDAVASGTISSKLAKVLAVGLIEAVQHLPDRDRRPHDRPRPVPSVR